MSRESDMEATIARLDSPDKLEQFAINVESHSKPHADAARRRAVQLRAAEHGAKSDTELECLEAIYAYERSESKSLWCCAIPRPSAPRRSRLHEHVCRNGAFCRSC